ncbi:MAG: hypothetical protein AAF667_08985 [Pseudomonadota bacterium]
MLIKSLRLKSPSQARHAAEAWLPIALSTPDAEAAFAAPLGRRMATLGIGQVTGTKPRAGDAGAGISLDLMLASNHERILTTIARHLEDLDAPVGSSVGFAGSTGRVNFGRAEALGLFLGSVDDTARLDVLEACVDALDAAGRYHGSIRKGHDQVLVFTGDNFNAMVNALRFVIASHPACPEAFTRRLSDWPG